jgi:hypothetical protein
MARSPQIFARRNAPGNPFAKQANAWMPSPALQKRKAQEPFFAGDTPIENGPLRTGE